MAGKSVVEVRMEAINLTLEAIDAASRAIEALQQVVPETAGWKVSGAEDRLRVWCESQMRGMRFTDRQAESFDALRSDYWAAVVDAERKRIIEALTARHRLNLDGAYEQDKLGNQHGADVFAGRYSEDAHALQIVRGET